MSDFLDYPLWRARERRRTRNGLLLAAGALTLAVGLAEYALHRKPKQARLVFQADPMPRSVLCPGLGSPIRRPEARGCE